MKKNRTISPKALLIIGIVALIGGYSLNTPIGTLIAIVGFIMVVSGAMQLASKKK